MLSTVSALSEPRHFQQRLILDGFFITGLPLSGTCEEAGWCEGNRIKRAASSYPFVGRSSTYKWPSRHTIGKYTSRTDCSQKEETRRLLPDKIV